MSNIKKNERKESKLQCIQNAIKIRRSISFLAENNFYIDEKKIDNIIEKRIKDFPDEEKQRIKERNYQYFNGQIQRITNSAINYSCGISIHLRKANTIFPIYMSEFEERRLEMDRAMECCNALQDELQYAGECLYADFNKYTNLVLDISKEFNMIKALRQTDNRFLKEIKKNSG